tara:strand:+ start:161 stop:367 length:207 start_codon:yes stop_codon:yes gene_type:complete
MKIPLNRSVNTELRQAIVSSADSKTRTAITIPNVEALNEGEMVIVDTDIYIRSGNKLIKFEGEEYIGG